MQKRLRRDTGFWRIASSFPAIRYVAITSLRARHAVPLRGRHKLMGFYKSAAFLAFTSIPSSASKLPCHLLYGFMREILAPICFPSSRETDTIHARAVGARRAVPTSDSAYR